MHSDPAAAALALCGLVFVWLVISVYRW